MALPLITIKQNDTAPAVVAYLKGSDPATPGVTIAQNLISASAVRFSMRSADGTLRVDRAACEVLDNATGKVTYKWAANDTAIAGMYQAEFEVTFADGTIMSFPNDGYITVVITAQVA